MARRAHAEARAVPRSELMLVGSAGLFPYVGVTPALTYRYGHFATSAAVSVGFTLGGGTARELSLGLGLAPLVSPRFRGLVFGTVGVLNVQNVGIAYACGPGWFAFAACNPGIDATVPFVGVRLELLGASARERLFAGATLGLDYALSTASQPYRSCHQEDDWLFDSGPSTVCDSGTASLTRFLVTAQVSLGVSLL